MVRMMRIKWSLTFSIASNASSVGIRTVAMTKWLTTPEEDLAVLNNDDCREAFTMCTWFATVVLVQGSLANHMSNFALGVKRSQSCRDV